jgi:hypothetical protein
MQPYEHLEPAAHLARSALISILLTWFLLVIDWKALKSLICKDDDDDDDYPGSGGKRLKLVRVPVQRD